MFSRKPVIPCILHYERVLCTYINEIAFVTESYRRNEANLHFIVYITRHTRLLEKLPYRYGVSGRFIRMKMYSNT
jgi:hypothetical protein